MTELEQWQVAAAVGFVMLGVYFWRSWRRFVHETEKDSHWLHD